MHKQYCQHNAVCFLDWHQSIKMHIITFTIIFYVGKNHLIKILSSDSQI